VRYGRSSDGDHAHQAIDSHVVIRAGGEQGKTFSDGGRRDHEIYDAASRLAPRGHDRGRDATEDAGGLRVKWDGVELALDALQYL